MKVVRDLNPELWRQFVNEQPDGNIFHTPEIFEVFAQAKGHQSEIWAIVEGNYILALLPITKISLMSGILRHLTTRSVAYGGFLARVGPSQEKALDLLLQVYNKESNNSLFTELRHQNEIKQPIRNVLLSYNYKFEEYDNFLIDLALPVQQVFNNIKKSTRKKIRQAEKKGQLSVKEVDNLEKLSVWYNLIQKTYKNARIPLADFSLFEACFNYLHPKGMVQFFLGQVDNTYIAASVNLLYKDVIYGWYRGFDREYSHYLPNDLMVWNLLKWGSENNYRLFDFGGAGRPNTDYGPRRFKSKFGGKLVSYGRSIYTHKPFMLNLSKTGYKLYRQIGINDP